MTEMNDQFPRRTYQAIVDEACAATGASCGWLLGQGQGALIVLATSGATDPDLPVGSQVPARGARGFALSANQAAALVPSPYDLSNSGIGGFIGVPPNLVVAPGSSEGGAVIEVADKLGAGAFTFEDIELLGAFANIAESAVADHGDSEHTVATPAQLAAELLALAEFDGRRYRELATVIEALLATVR